MFSTGLILKLKPGCEEEYRRRHDELWPEMTDAMRKAGVSMVIYLHENLLFVYAQAASQKAWDELERDPVTPRWDKYMNDVLEHDAHGKQYVRTLGQMFAFGDFA